MLLRSGHLHELRKQKGHGQVFDASAAFRFEVPVANLQQAVQELQIGGARRQAYLFLTRFLDANR